MEMNGGFLVTKIKQLGDRIFEKILSEKNIDAFNGAQGRILYVLWQEDGISIRSLSTTMLVASILCGMLCTTIFLPMPHRILMPMFPLSIPSPRLALLVLPERILLTVQSM